MKSDPSQRYVYVSKRLTREIVERTTATTRTRDVQVSLLSRAIGLVFPRREPAWGNDVEMAMRATVAVSDEIGTLDPKASGTYVQASCQLYSGVVRVHMPDIVVGLLTGRLDTPWGRALICLVGSPSNFHGWSDNDVPKLGGWSPSELHGLTGIAGLVLEDGDRLGFDAWDAEEEVPEVAADLAERLCSRIETEEHWPRRHLEFLAEVHVHGRVEARPGDDHDLLLLGAAVWARETPARPISN